MLRQLVEVAEQQDMAHGSSNLRLIRSVSSPLPKDLYEAAQRIFSTTLVEIYGMTETAGVITSNSLDPELQKPGSVGVSAGPEIRIVNTGGVARPMEIGEVQVKGSSTMQGYLSNSPEKIPGQEFEDGWLLTGDLGFLDDDGHLFLTGRLKDIINRGGEKISPTEIDIQTLGFPGVSDAASFPITDTALGEDIALAVVMKNNTALSYESLRSYLKASLAYFKIPRQIIQVDAIPRHNGKLRRQELAAQFLAEDIEPDKVATAEKTLGDDSSDELAAMWAEILEQETIGSEDDFFFMGGNSLLATILVNRIQEQWGIPVMVSALYEAPILHEFKQYLQEHYPEQMENIYSRVPRD